MKSLRTLMAFAALLFGVVPSHADDALKPGDMIGGKLRLVKTQHPNGTAIRAYQIVSDAPKVFAAKDEFCNGVPKTFHLVAGKPEAAKLKPLLGKKVTIVAEEFFCSHTAWHIGDAVVLKWKFAAPR